MALNDWVQTAAIIYFAWRQNRIFERQNEIFAGQAGQTAMPPNTSQMRWIGRYWPTLVMVGLMVLTGYDIYARHGAPSIVPWWFYALLLVIVVVIGLVIGGLARTQTSPVLMLPTEKPKQPSKLIIHSANYRAVENGGDEYEVGDFLRQIISGDCLFFDIETSNFVIGDKNFVPRDPLLGKEKRLRVKYSYGGSSPVTTERRQHGRLLLPEDSKIKWLTGENQRLANEVQRLTPAAPKIVKLSDRVVDEPTATYPLKLRMHLRNDSAVTVDIKLQEYRADLVTVKGFPTEVFQIRLRDSWYPKEHGAGRIALYPGQEFEAWIALDESKFNRAQVEGYRGKIGTLVLQVNGQNIEIKL